ncbi:hypothetical protein AQI88_37635 [Streptomyces cellostaticus]|uniref:Uncharacterized protein n=2 Tax=Streptomyces cellostaticus TaxID=67285 RepID=A0A101NDR0_9ACTN|nr:hypothetical protein AQI88_37635 [Streptomyces cellostaticus]GHI09466.1 hypothetical protein Scel_77870 [Streptomyces cellostaticus]
MRVRIEVIEVVEAERGEEPDAHAEAVRSLYQWLVSDPGVGSAVDELSLASGNSAAAPDEETDLMGSTALDAVVAVLNGAAPLAQLALTAATWRLSHPRRPQVRLERDGTTVLLYSTDPEEIRQLVEALSATNPEPHPLAHRTGDHATPSSPE